MRKITEIKCHKNKPDQQFVCDVALAEPGYIVIVYHAEKAGRISDIHIAPGSTTIAHYWQDGGYVLWRMFSRDKSLIGTLFHICRDTDINETEVRYTDLLLDIWIGADGAVRVLDEDELADAIQAGLVTEDEQRWIGQQKEIILIDYSDIIDRIRDTESTILNQKCRGE
jgi:hypothetical protein